MIIKFFPTMSKDTVETFFATLFIIYKFFCHVPIFTFKSFLAFEIWSFKILPVMCKNALVFVMIDFWIRTKFRFKEIKKKFFVFIHFIKKTNFDFVFCMSHSTEISKFTFFIRESYFAEFLFIIIWMIKLFYCVVREFTFGIFTILSLWTE